MDNKKKFLERLYDAARDPKNANRLYFHEDGVHLVVSKEPVPEFPKTASLCRNLNMYRLLVDKEKEPIPGKSIYGLPKHRLGELTREEFCSIPRRPVKHKPSSSSSATASSSYSRPNYDRRSNKLSSSSEEEEEVGEDEEEDDEEESDEDHQHAHKQEAEERQRVMVTPPFTTTAAVASSLQKLHQQLLREEQQEQTSVVQPLTAEESDYKRSRLFRQHQQQRGGEASKFPDLPLPVAAGTVLANQQQQQQSLAVHWEDEDMLTGEHDFSMVNFAKLDKLPHFKGGGSRGSSGTTTPTDPMTATPSKQGSAASNEASTTQSSLADEMAHLAWWEDEHHPQHQQLLALQQQHQQQHHHMQNPLSPTRSTSSTPHSLPQLSDSPSGEHNPTANVVIAAVPTPPPPPSKLTRSSPPPL